MRILPRSLIPERTEQRAAVRLSALYIASGRIDIHPG